MFLADPGDAFAVSVSSGPIQGAGKYDADCDGSTNASDALYLLRVLAGLQLQAAACDSDVNGNGSVDLEDGLSVRRWSAGLPH